jgi:hypothetical protein
MIERGFFLTTEWLTIRKQAPKADPARLSFWQEGSRTHLSIGTSFHHVEKVNDSGASSGIDDGFSVMLADNCLRVSLYGLKLLWTIENRNAVWAWVGDITHAFETPMPSPARQFAQRKMVDTQQKSEEQVKESSEGDRNSFSLASCVGRPFSSTPFLQAKGKVSTSSGKYLSYQKICL